MPSSTPDVSTEIDVGERLRAIRRSRRCTLRTVATRSGLSESFLSQVERGRSSASIASLRRIADALGVSMADLFAAQAIAQGTKKGTLQIDDDIVLDKLGQGQPVSVSVIAVNGQGKQSNEPSLGFTLRLGGQ